MESFPTSIVLCTQSFYSDFVQGSGENKENQGNWWISLTLGRWWHSANWQKAPMWKLAAAGLMMLSENKPPLTNAGRKKQ